MLFFFLPKFLPHFWVKLLFMLLIAFQVLSSIIRFCMSAFLGHPLTIITFPLSNLLVSFFFSLMSTTNLSLNLDFFVSLDMAKLKKGIDVMILSLTVFMFLIMLYFGNIACLLNSLTFVLTWLPPLFLKFFQIILMFLLQILLILFWTSLSNLQIFFMLLLDRSKINKLMTSYPTLSLGPLLLLRLKILHKTFHLTTQLR